MIRVVTIDDEPLALRQLEMYIGKIPFLELVAACPSAAAARPYVERADILYVDINMPDLSGMDFVRSLEHPPLVVFTTAYSEYALEGFKVHAADYLLKPFSFQEFEASAAHLRDRIEAARPRAESRPEALIPAGGIDLQAGLQDRPGGSGAHPVRGKHERILENMAPGRAGAAGGPVQPEAARGAVAGGPLPAHPSLLSREPFGNPRIHALFRHAGRRPHLACGGHLPSGAHPRFFGEIKRYSIASIRPPSVSRRAAVFAVAPFTIREKMRAGLPCSSRM